MSLKTGYLSLEGFVKVLRNIWSEIPSGVSVPDNYGRNETRPYIIPGI